MSTKDSQKVQITISKRTAGLLSEYKSRTGNSKVNYNTLISYMLNDIATSSDITGKLHGDIKRSESALAEQESKASAHIANLTSQLNRVNRVNRNLLELFIISVGGTPPGAEE